MHDFQWVVSGSFLHGLRGELIAALLVLLAVLVCTAVLVGIELRKNRKESNEDKRSEETL